jgi:hypothetical protein
VSMLLTSNKNSRGGSTVGSRVSRGALSLLCVYRTCMRRVGNCARSPGPIARGATYVLSPPRTEVRSSASEVTSGPRAAPGHRRSQTVNSLKRT